jgi:hypothetical protein
VSVGGQVAWDESLMIQGGGLILSEPSIWTSENRARYERSKFATRATEQTRSGLSLKVAGAKLSHLPFVGVGSETRRFGGA